MKKIFLVFGIVGSYTAAAQLKSLPDLQKRLDENNLLKKSILFLPINPSLSLPKPLYRLPGGDAVISLPVDNMSCIVPGLDNIVLNMPNAAGNSLLPIVFTSKPRAGDIPNPAPFIPFIQPR